MATLRKFLDLEKYKIQISTDEGDYEGTVGAIFNKEERLRIDNIYFLPDRLYMGSLYFYIVEISDFTVLGRDESVSDDEDTYARARRYESRPCDGDIFDEYEDIDGFSDCTSVDQEYPEVEYVLELPPNFKSVPLDVVTFDAIGEEFIQAVDHIKKETSIGISLEGPKLGRYGTICWLCVSTSCCTFLFDIEELGSKVFENGLREVFESSSILKVVHDCREVSDCLFHMFHTRLANVFDTQVADKLVQVQRSRDGKINKHVSSLVSCLRTYLDVPEEYLYKYNLSEFNPRIFDLRPPPCDFQDVMVKNVVYLRLLGKKLTQEMLNPFTRAVEVYSQVLQSASEQELLLDKSKPDELPQELTLEGIQIVRFKDHKEMPPVVASGPPYRKTKNPIKQFLRHCEERGDNPLPDAVWTPEEKIPDRKKPEYKRRVKLDKCISFGSAMIYVTDDSDSVPSANAESNKYKNPKFCGTNYSRRELDEMYRLECSKVPAEDEKGAPNRDESDEQSSQEDDPWAAFREDFSKCYDPIADDPEMKRRFVPAGRA